MVAVVVEVVVVMEVVVEEVEEVVEVEEEEVVVEVVIHETFQGHFTLVRKFDHSLHSLSVSLHALQIPYQSSLQYFPTPLFAPFS